MYPSNIVCFRCMTLNTLRQGDDIIIIIIIIIIICIKYNVEYFKVTHFHHCYFAFA